MDKIYYQPNHLWKGQAAVKKLKELSGEKPKQLNMVISTSILASAFTGS